MKSASNEKLEIVMLGHKRVPSREGGIEVVVEELSTRMVALGHKVICYNRSGHHVSGNEYDSDTIKEYKGIVLKKVITINKKGLAAVTSSLFGAIKAAFSKCDVVHFHAEGPCAMIWIPKLFRKRCIATIHGLDHQRAKWGKFASSYIMLGEKNAVRYADEIIVLSKNVQKYFFETYGRETKFIANGVNRPVLIDADLIKTKYGLEKNSYILYLGRLVPEKGVKYLIEAYKAIKTDKKLVIAGGSSDTDNYYNEIKELSKDNEMIIFTGFIQGKILSELYSNAYIYTLPSDIEGMPLSLLEAMSYGNCCLTSDINECVEVTKDYAVTFKKSDINDLASKLQYLCSDINIVNQYKSNAADYICSCYNWDSIVKDTLKLYEG